MDTYKQKYKEALERAKSEWVNNLDNAYKNYRERLGIIFPELVESEDERIRKELISFVNNDGWKFTKLTKEEKESWIDWLEKQAPKAIHEEKVDNANKVEPKFHEGDWIVNNDSGGICQVTEIKDDEYCLWPLDAEIMGYLRIIDVDNDYHLWTIKDAKDGDVLCYKDEVFLYKHDIKNCTKKETTFGGIVYYCCYDGKRFITDSLYSLSEQNKIDIHPAVKEQRDLLFQKMREAGYEWDKEKKELSKIEKQCEQKPTLRERYESIAQSEWFKRTHNGMSVSDEEPKWTKEDDERQISITEYLNELYDDNRFSLDELTDLETWLKSLKQRIGWKPNKEQIKALHDLNLVGNISYVGQAQLLIELYNDLKKLIV